MDATPQLYRLEVAVKRVYGLSPTISGTAGRIAVEVRFLDFPTIVIHPQGYVVGDAATYNVCHKADFRMTPEQASVALPAMCQCQLSSDSDSNLASPARWSCPCPLQADWNSRGTLPPPPQQQQQQQHTYAHYVISNAAGEAVGYVEMSCVVLLLAPQVAASRSMPGTTRPASPPPMQHQQQQYQPYQQQPRPAPAPPPPPQQSASSYTPLPHTGPQPPVAPQPSTPDPYKPNASAEHGKPYIVRVVVSESDRGHRKNHLPRRDEMENELAGNSGRGVAAAREVGRRGSPMRHRESFQAASKDSLLSILQYDVAYQLQSLSETVAAALLREHDVLTRTALTSGSADGAVTIPKLTRSIDRGVANLVRLANIVLQVANQLVDNSAAPLHAGTSREVKDLARQRRNPVNKLPTPADGSVSCYLQYDVLYQLQCLGTNLSYMTLAYRKALDTPLAALPKQHVEFCVSVGDEIQRVAKLLNILIQSSVDGAFGGAAPLPTSAKKAASGKKRTDAQKHRDHTSAAGTARKSKASARPLSMSYDSSSFTSSSTRSSSGSTVASSSSSSSSLSSADSWLNRPMTPVSAPPSLTPPVALPTAVPPPTPHPVAASTSPILPTTAPVPTVPVTVPQPVPAPAPAPAAATVTASQKSPDNSLSVPVASPFSWVDPANNFRIFTTFSPQSSASAGSFDSRSNVPPPQALSNAPQTFVPPIASSPTNAPPLAMAPPQLSLASLVPPPAFAPPPPPALSAAPTPIALNAAAPPPPPQLRPGGGIPLPIPLPR